MKDDEITKSKLCLLCKGDPKPHLLGLYHNTNGKTWKPEKGHKDYQLHLRMIKLLNK